MKLSVKLKMNTWDGKIQAEIGYSMQKIKVDIDIILISSSPLTITIFTGRERKLRIIL